MGYRVRDDGDTGAGIRRIARELIDAAIEDACEGFDDPETTVHEVRKRCEKLHGLVRLGGTRWAGPATTRMSGTAAWPGDWPARAPPSHW